MKQHVFLIKEVNSFVSNNGEIVILTSLYQSAHVHVCMVCIKLLRPNLTCLTAFYGHVRLLVSHQPPAWISEIEYITVISFFI